MNIKYNLILISFLLSILGFFFTLNSSVKFPGYEYLFLLPISYFIGLLIVSSTLTNSKLLRHKITLSFIWVLGTIRLILIPISISLASQEPGISYINPSPSNINEAIVMIAYEWFTICVFLSVYFSLLVPKSLSEERDHLPILSGNKFIYLLFVTVSFLLMIYYGLTSPYINFIYIDLGSTGERIGDETNTLNVLLLQVIQIGIMLSFLMFINNYQKKYAIYNRNIYFYIPLAFALISLLIIVGERRSTQIYMFLILTYILIIFYKNKKKQILTYLSSAVLLVLVLMSIYKFSYAFLHGSYTAALQSSTFEWDEVSSLLQSYFFGPENVAIAIEFSKQTLSNNFNFIFDFFRSVFGFSFLFKESSYQLTSTKFNTFIYGYDRSNGHLLSSLGYGYLYFGPILAPICTLFNISIAILLEKLLPRLKSLEILYLVLFILFRYSFGLFGSPPPLISLSTIMLGTAGTLFLISIAFRIRVSTQKV
ncbi:MAG: hypothetical protein C0432_06280 [Candidatus Puniceispirillum sp.]|nr:hypothetical protein [Candidatus Puniceispirillum sp.]